MKRGDDFVQVGWIGRKGDGVQQAGEVGGKRLRMILVVRWAQGSPARVEGAREEGVDGLVVDFHEPELKIAEVVGVGVDQDDGEVWMQA